MLEQCSPSSTHAYAKGTWRKIKKEPTAGGDRRNSDNLHKVGGKAAPGFPACAFPLSGKPGASGQARKNYVLRALRLRRKAGFRAWNISGFYFYFNEISMSSF